MMRYQNQETWGNCTMQKPLNKKRFAWRETQFITHMNWHMRVDLSIFYLLIQICALLLVMLKKMENSGTKALPEISRNQLNQNLVTSVPGLLLICVNWTQRTALLQTNQKALTFCWKTECFCITVLCFRNLSWFCRLLMFFYKISLFLVFFLKWSFGNINRVPSSLDPDHAWRFVGPYLGPNCLQR